MPKAPQKTAAELVAEYFDQLDHPLKDAVQALRQIILSADPSVGEQIKWNSPGFYYMGEMKPFDPKEYKRDIVVLNLHKKDQVLLIFPTGAKVQDTTGLLEGSFTDGRKMITLRSLADAESKAKDLQQVVSAWLKLVDR
jgi:hypothetical protein